MRETPTTGATQLCGQAMGGIECPAQLKLDGTCNARMAGTCIATGRHLYRHWTAGRTGPTFPARP